MLDDYLSQVEEDTGEVVEILSQSQAEDPATQDPSKLQLHNCLTSIVDTLKQHNSRWVSRLRRGVIYLNVNRIPRYHSFKYCNQIYKVRKVVRNVIQIPWLSSRLLLSLY